MKRLSLIFAALLFTLPSLAQYTATRTVRPNIYPGALNVSGSITFGSDQAGNSYTRMDPMMTYFIDSNLAVGGMISMWSVGGSNNYAVGPLVDYYFFLRDRMAASGGSSLLMYSTQPGGTYYAIQPNAKFLYFITPSVAFGPAFFYSLYLNQPTYVKNDSRFVGMFSIYL